MGGLFIYFSSTLHKNLSKVGIYWKSSLTMCTDQAADLPQRR